jgi:peptide/nickel transport system ATP-binding protein
MLFISHNLAVVRYTSDIVAVMYLGRIVEMGPAEQVLTDPQHPYTRELLAAVPRRGAPLIDLSDSDTRLQAVADAEPGDPHARPRGCMFHPRCPIGPLVYPERQICVTSDPQEAAADRLHRAACHFTTEPVGVASGG